jgi:hypothetical protein
MPTTPPARKASRSAFLVPDSLAALATRRLVRVASVMPMKPTSAENSAPTRKKIGRPTRTALLSAGSRNSRRKTRTAKTASVLNWRDRYAAAPSWTALAISIIFGVPCPAASTSRANTAAKPSAMSDVSRMA